MEKACAACGLEWSKELERGLRSQKLGQRLNSIHLIGRRLERWGCEPNLKMSTCNLFELVPGEDKLFADSILLRLADAFVYGDANIRTQVVKVFLSDRQHQGRKKGQGRGILSVMTADNRLELIRRVRVTLDNGESESKALTLALFGCWAEFSNDMPEIRYAVLSSLVSSSVLEVKASLFAAGCFCEYSDDFSSILLVMIINVISSPKTLSIVKVAALQTLAKVGISPLLTNKAYKAGSTTLPKLSRDDSLPLLLISLSKLASRSITLSCKQVSLLCELLSQDITTHTQTVVLKCIRYIVDRLARGPFGRSSFVYISRMLDEPMAFSALGCEGLRVIAQVISDELHHTELLKTHDFEKLLRIIKYATKAESIDERILATQALVDISIRVKGWSTTAHGVVSHLPLLPDIISSIGKEITVLMMPLPEQSERPQVEQHLKSFLALLLIIIDGWPGLSLLVLDNMSSLVKEFTDVHENDVRTTDASSNVLKTSKLLWRICNFLAVCIERWAAYNGITAEVVSKVKHLVIIVCQSAVFSCRVHLSFYMLLLQCSCLAGDALPENQKNRDEIILDMKGIPVGMFLHNMLKSRNSYWSGYLAGVSAACEGVWSVAHPIFQQLSTVVNSDIYHVWLGFLSQFAHLEKSIQVIFMQEYCSPFLDEGIIQSVHGLDADILSMGSIQVLVDVCDGLRSSGRMLGAGIMPKEIFCFKQWFLALRLEVLEAVVNVAKLVSGTADEKGSMSMADLSFKFKKIADKYDLMTTAFTKMGSKSQEVIASLALGCSLLALCTGFCSSGLSSGNCFSPQMTLIHDIVCRLQDTDPVICKTLLSIFNENATYKIPSPLYSQSCFHNAVSGVGHLRRVCREAVEGIADLQKESRGMDDENTSLPVENKRRQVLLKIINEWFHAPFRIPKIFFQQRPCVGSALVCSNANRDERGKLSVSQGSHLSLNLCLQLKNMPPDAPSRVTKILCILHCRRSPLMVTCEEPHVGFDSLDHRAWTTNTMMLLHKKLQWYVRNSYDDSTCSVDVPNGDDNDDSSVVESCVSFETTGSAQVYSSSLLDVSSFLVGSYRILWLSCCVDGDGSFTSLLPMNHGPMFAVT